ERISDVRFTPRSRHAHHRHQCLLCAFENSSRRRLIVRAAGAGIRQKRVRLPVAGFGYSLSVSLYFLTTSSAGLAAHRKSAPTWRSSCGSISMLYIFGYPAMGALAENMPGSRWGPMFGRMDIRKIHAPLLPPCGHQIGTDEGQQAVAAPGLA